MQILIHIHLSSHSCYKPGDKSWMMRGKWHIPIHKATFIYPNQLPFKILSYIHVHGYIHWTGYISRNFLLWIIPRILKCIDILKFYYITPQGYIGNIVSNLIKFSCYIRSPSIWQNPIRGHEPMVNQWKRRCSNLNSGFIRCVCVCVCVCVGGGGGGGGGQEVIVS